MLLTPAAGFGLHLPSLQRALDIGVAGVALAAGFVWFSFRTRGGSRPQLYALLFYSAVLACCVVYLAWWYGTGQKLDTP